MESARFAKLKANWIGRGLGAAYHKDEQKVGRHRGVDARQAHFEERGCQRYGQERCEAQRVSGMPVEERVRQQWQAKNQLREDKRDRRPPEELPLFSGGAPHLLPHRHCNSTSLTPHGSFRLALAKISGFASTALRSGNDSAPYGCMVLQPTAQHPCAHRARAMAALRPDCAAGPRLQIVLAAGFVSRCTPC